MVIDVRSLPDLVREAAAQAREHLPNITIVPIEVAPLPAKFASWASVYVTSGELDRDLSDAHLTTRTSLTDCDRH